jgi:hypothetical protein
MCTAADRTLRQFHIFGENSLFRRKLISGLTESGRIFLLPPVHDILTLNFEGQVSFRLQISFLLKAECSRGSNSKQFARDDSNCFVNHSIGLKLNIHQVTKLQILYFKSMGYILSIMLALLQQVLVILPAVSDVVLFSALCHGLWV